MWLPTRAFDLFRVAKDTVDDQRTELSALRSERDLLKSQLATTQSSFEWLRLRVNALEVERAQLMDKAYGVKLPVPEIVRASSTPIDLNSFGNLFEHIDDEEVKKLDPTKLSN